jgi:glycosyltransferase involved in cell wall biosynthesis
MQLLHVISSMDAKGGGVSQAVRLFIAGSEPGVQHEVVSCDSPDAGWLGGDPFPIHALGPGKFGYAYSPRLLPWLAENLPRFDAVIVHGLWLWPSVATRIALRKLGKTESLTGLTGFSGVTGASAGSIERSPSEEPNEPGSDGKSICEQSQASSVPEDFESKSQHPDDETESYSSRSLRSSREPSLHSSENSTNPKHRVPRCFVMPHGMLDPYFQRAPERRIKAIRNWIYWKLIEHRVINGADGVLFTCEEEMRLAREPFRPYNPKAEKVVGLGTEEPPPYEPSMTEAFAKACPDLGDQPYILFLGRIHPKKGVDMLIRAYARVKAESGNWKVEKSFRVSASSSFPINDQPSTINRGLLPALVIAGPCHDREYLQKLKDESSVSIRAICGSKNVSVSTNHSVHSVHSVPNCIHFVDMISGDAKWGALYGCDAFILPSHQENFGIAVVEALACGKPVLLSNKVNIWREIEADGAGLVEDDSDEGTENLLRRFIAQLTISSQTARRSFVQSFTIQQAAKSLQLAVQTNSGGAFT